jgi:hypothetical protein
MTTRVAGSIPVSLVPGLFVAPPQSITVAVASKEAGLAAVTGRDDLSVVAPGRTSSGRDPALICPRSGRGRGGA